MNRLLGPTVTLSALTVGSQLVTLATQIVVASIFGAGADYDAYLAAFTLPAYFNAVVLSGLVFVFIPVFVGHRTRGEESVAWQVVSRVLVLFVILLSLCILIGLFASEWLLRATVPGLSPSTLRRAVTLAVVLWPTMLLTGLSSLLTGLHHAYERFAWPALTPIAGGVTMFAVVAGLGHRGIDVLAFAMLASALLQCALLLPITVGRLVRPVPLLTPELRETLGLMAPFIISAAFTQAILPIERFVASTLPPGSIAHLGYATKITANLAALLTGGIAVTLFPLMARLSAVEDRAALKSSVVVGLRATWLLAAPAIALGLATGSPLVAVLLERGAFQSGDTAAVAGVFRWDLIGLIGMVGGSITARALYALKRMRTMSGLAIGRVAVYAGSAQLCGDLWGTMGLAAAGALSWLLLFLGQSVCLWYLLRPVEFKQFGIAVGRITVAAAATGVAAYGLSTQGNSQWLAASFGLVGGGAVYAAALALLGAREWSWLVGAGQDAFAAARSRIGL